MFSSSPFLNLSKSLSWWGSNTKRRRHRRNMRTGRLETIFICDVGNGVDEAIGASVRIGALHDLRFQLRSRILQVALLIRTNSICRFVTVHIRSVRVGLVNMFNRHCIPVTVDHWDDAAQLGRGGREEDTGTNEEESLWDIFKINSRIELSLLALSELETVYLQISS